VALVLAQRRLAAAAGAVGQHPEAQHHLIRLGLGHQIDRQRRAPLGVVDRQVDREVDRLAVPLERQLGERPGAGGADLERRLERPPPQRQRVVDRPRRRQRPGERDVDRRVAVDRAGQPVALLEQVLGLARRQPRARPQRLERAEGPLVLAEPQVRAERPLERLRRAALDLAVERQRGLVLAEALAQGRRLEQGLLAQLAGRGLARQRLVGRGCLGEQAERAQVVGPDEAAAQRRPPTRRPRARPPARPSR
jgi:hypothetical protein